MPIDLDDPFKDSCCKDERSDRWLQALVVQFRQSARNTRPGRLQAEMRDICDIIYCIGVRSRVPQIEADDKQARGAQSVRIT